MWQQTQAPGVAAAAPGAAAPGAGPVLGAAARGVERESCQGRQQQQGPIQPAAGTGAPPGGYHWSPQHFRDIDSVSLKVTFLVFPVLRHR